MEVCPGGDVVLNCSMQDIVTLIWQIEPQITISCSENTRIESLCAGSTNTSYAVVTAFSKVGGVNNITSFLTIIAMNGNMEVNCSTNGEEIQTRYELRQSTCVAKFIINLLVPSNPQTSLTSDGIYNK